MQIFNLPPTTKVNRVIPKNSFDTYTTPKQKRLFSEVVDKIRWANKCSVETINLSGKDVTEIQVFEISLKKKASITELLNIIDRSIPYHIVFVVTFDSEAMFSASYKHQHPTNEDQAVIDWAFQSPWLDKESAAYRLELKQNLDFVFTHFCKALSGRASEKLTLAELIAKEQKVKELKSAVSALEAAIKSAKQFNKKVELNLQLQGKLKSLDELK